MNRSFLDRKASACALVVVFVFAAAAAFSGRYEPVHASVAPMPAATPIYSGYKGVKVGMTADETRKLLGAPKEKSDESDYFVFSDKESAQVYYDSSHAVIAVSVTYVGKGGSIPTPKDVFGDDAEVKPDGSIMKFVRYPTNGFWVSYNRTAGDDPLIIITLQKIAGSPES